MRKIATLTFCAAAVLACVMCTQDYDVLWKYEVGKGVNRLAIGSDGSIYAASYREYITDSVVADIYAFKPDGTLKWKYPLHLSNYLSQPSVGSDGTVYLVSYEGYFYALNPDGTLKWREEIDGGGYGDYAVGNLAIGSDGTIYVRPSDGNLHAYDSLGSLKWTYENVSSPVIGPEGTLYCRRYSGSSVTLLALDSDGSVEWEYDLGGESMSSPAIGSDGTLYFGVYVYNSSTGTDTLYFYALGPDTVLQWKYTLVDGLFITSPVIDVDGTIYVSVRENDEYLYALSPEGTLKWKCELDISSSSTPAIGSDGTIYVGNNNGYLYAIGRDGTLKLEYRIAKGEFLSNINSPVIASDGTIYFSAGNGYIYAIPTESYGLADSPWPKPGYDNQNTNRAD